MRFPPTVLGDAPESVKTATADDASSLPDGQERLSEAFDALPDGVAVLSSIRDQSGRITDFLYEYANKALLRQVELSPEHLIGRQLLDVSPAAIESGLFADCCELVESEICSQGSRSRSVRSMGCGGSASASISMP